MTINRNIEEAFDTIRTYLPSDSSEIIELLLNKRDSAAILARRLPTTFTPDNYLGHVNASKAHMVWNAIGFYYRLNNRFVDANKIYLTQYQETIRAQEKTGIRIHKGTPLCWTFDVYKELQCPVLAKRYIMLTLVEDAITNQGIISPEGTGVYFRLNWMMGMPDSEIYRYVKEVWELYQKHSLECLYPEWVLQRLDTNWMTEFPSSNELLEYVSNVLYIQKFVSAIGESSGTNLERLAEYLLSCVPGIRARCRQKTDSTDYDVVCALEGNYLDYRSAIDRYFICECKDWNNPADVTTILKFSSVLRSIKTNFGILFTTSGITGSQNFKDARRELVKFYQSEGIVIIVIDLGDLRNLAEGGNFITLLRRKYEEVRLDFRNS